MGYRVPEAAKAHAEIHLQELTHLFGLRVVNYATSEDVALVSKNTGEPCSRLPTSEQITQVPRRRLSWRTANSKAPASNVDYARPLDIPESGVLAVITAETYVHLQAYNDLNPLERIDLSWMLVLGKHISKPQRVFQLLHRLAPAERQMVHGFYHGLLLTPEVLGNTAIHSREFLSCIGTPALAPV